MSEKVVNAANKALAETWAADCGPDEEFCRKALTTLTTLDTCSADVARSMAECFRNRADYYARTHNVSRADVLSAADTLDHLADKMHT